MTLNAIRFWHFFKNGLYSIWNIAVVNLCIESSWIFRTWIRKHFFVAGNFLEVCERASVLACFCEVASTNNVMRVGLRGSTWAVVLAWKIFDSPSTQSERCVCLVHFWLLPCVLKSHFALSGKEGNAVLFSKESFDFSENSKQLEDVIT